MLNKFKNEDPACVTKKETTATFLCLTQKHSCLAEECSLKCHFKQREVQTKLEHGLVTHTHTKKHSKAPVCSKSQPHSTKTALVMHHFPADGC